MNKLEKILQLTSGKTHQFSLCLNYDLVDLFKKAAQKNNIKLTRIMEIWMLNYIEENGLLED